MGGLDNEVGIENVFGHLSVSGDALGNSHAEPAQHERYESKQKDGPR